MKVLGRVLAWVRAWRARPLNTSEDVVKHELRARGEKFGVLKEGERGAYIVQK